MAGDLRLFNSQFQEVEVFAYFGTQLDEQTRNTLIRGRRVREILKQPQSQPLQVAEQIAVLLAITSGVFDSVALEEIDDVSKALCQIVRRELASVCQNIETGEKLTDEEYQAIMKIAKQIVKE